jgi:hypothetical protein
MKQTPNERRPQILKVEYLSNHGLDVSKILNLSQGNQTEVYRSLKILKVEYLSNHWSDLTQILNLR